MLKNKKNKKLIKEELLLQVYDLILNKEIFEDERIEFINFKNSIEKGKEFERELTILAEQLRILSLKKLSVNQTFSDDVGKFYIKISSNNLFKKNLGIGIVGISFLGK